MTKLFIGLPVYNGERFLTRTIESLRQQTFTDWEMLISDNCSTDKTEEIGQRFAALDFRIHFHRHKRNYGMALNYLYVLNKANAEFFMWASHDDIWLSDFIRSCILFLEGHQEYDIAFTNIEAIDSYDRVIRQVPDLRRLTSKIHALSVIKYLLDPEILGKCNILYGIYRTNRCKRTMTLGIPIIYKTNSAVSDNTFVLSILSRHKFAIIPKISFQKREERKSDKREEIHRVNIKNPSRYLILRGFAKYLIDQTRIVQGTKYFWLPPLIMYFRLFLLMAQVPYFIKKIGELLPGKKNRASDSNKDYVTYI